MPSTGMAAHRPMTIVSGSRFAATAARILPADSSSEMTVAPVVPKGVGRAVSSMDMAQTSAASSSETVRMTFRALP